MFHARDGAIFSKNSTFVFFDGASPITENGIQLRSPSPIMAPGGHMIKCLVTELGQTGRENIWLSVRTHGPRCARSVRPDLEPNIFPSGPPSQSIST